MGQVWMDHLKGILAKMFTFPFTFYGDGNGFLDSIVSNMELELDASETSSYSGSGQTWSNLIADPDSGASQTDNDFFLGADSGASTDDPTFNVDRFDLDGGDLFTHTVDTTFMNAINLSTNANITFIIIYDKGPTLGSLDFFFSSDFIAGGGLSFDTKNDGDLTVRQDTGGTPLTQVINFNIVTSTTDNLLILSFNGTNDRLDAWDNSKVQKALTSVGFDTTDTEDSSANSATIAANINTQFLPSGDSIKYFAIRNKETLDAEAESIIDHLGTRHGVDYS